jgi:amidase
MIDYPSSSASELARALAAGKVSALELCEAAIDAIEARDPPINAVVVRDFDRAREQARAADAALARGERAPLLGVPMTVKESHRVVGLPTTWGFERFKDWIPEFEGPPVTRLKAAGVIIVGKTNVPPALQDWQSANPIYGRTNNPHDLSRSPGGSSGGSAAAIAAGMVPLELGSDIGGSIRVPAHFCGVFGHKPTVKLVPGWGGSPPPTNEPGPPSDLSVAGPLARCAGDLELALSVMAGPESNEAKAYQLVLPAPRHSKLADYRVLALTDHPSCATDDEVKAVVEQTAGVFEAAGAKVARGTELLPDLAAAHSQYMPTLGTLTSRNRSDATPVNAHVWLGLLAAQHALQRRWATLFERFDIVLAPPFGTPAFPHIDDPNMETTRLLVNGDETRYGDQLAWPGVATFPGLPATVAPVGKSKTGLPIGVQIIGPFLEDLTSIRVAALVHGAMT